MKRMRHSSNPVPFITQILAWTKISCLLLVLGKKKWIKNSTWNKIVSLVLCATLIVPPQIAYSQNISVPDVSEKVGENEKISLAEAGAFFTPELDLDWTLLVRAAKGDPFGLSRQSYPPASENRFITDDLEFGPSLSVFAASGQAFLQNIDIAIGNGELRIDEKNDPKAHAYGRKHVFGAFKFQGYHVASDTVFLEVDDQSLPLSYQGFDSDKPNRSLVILSVNDLANHMGTRRIVMGIMPLPTPMGRIESIEFVPIDDPRAQKHQGYSDLLNRDFDTAGFVVKDEAGKEIWLPDYLPDVFLDMSKFLVRGIAAIRRPDLAMLQEKLPPELRRYQEMMMAYMDKHNDAFQGMIEKGLAELPGQQIAEVEPTAVTSAARRGLPKDITAPPKGTWLERAYGTYRVDPKAIEDAELQFREKMKKDWREYASAKASEATRMAQKAPSDHPTDAETAEAYKSQGEIAGLAQRIRSATGRAKSAVIRQMKGDLGNIVAVLAFTGIAYAAYQYTAFGGWADKIASSAVTLFSSPELIFKFLRNNTLALVGVFGPLAAAFFLFNTAANKFSGKNMSAGFRLGELGKYKTVGTYNATLPIRMLMRLLFPNYSKIYFMGSIPTRKNGGYNLRFSSSVHVAKEFFKALFTRFGLAGKENNSDLYNTAMKEDRKTEVEAEKGLSRFRNWAKEGKRTVAEAFDKAVEIVKTEKKNQLEQVKWEAEINRQAREAVLFEMAPLVADSYGVNVKEVVTTLAYSPTLFEQQSFSLDRDFLIQAAENGQVEELSEIWREHQQRKGRIADISTGLLEKYLSRRALRRFHKKIERAGSVRQLDAELKAIYLLAVRSVREGMTERRSTQLSQSEVQALFEEARQQQAEIAGASTEIQRATQEATLNRAIQYHSDIYQRIREFAKKGQLQRLFAATARVRPENIKKIATQLTMDYPLERFNAFMEFFKIFKDKGIAFFPWFGSLFSPHHFMGLPRHDAVHLTNTADWLTSGPLGHANITNRSGQDAIDKTVTYDGFVWRNLRQLANPDRFRQLGLDRNYFFEWGRSFSRGFRGGVAFSALRHSIFFGALQPDFWLTIMVMYGPLLRLWSYVEAKLMHATNANTFNRATYMQDFTERLLQERGAADINNLRFNDKMRLYKESFATALHPRWYYAFSGVVLFNVLTFFYTGFALEQGGIVQLVSQSIGEAFGHPEWAFNLMELKEEFIIPNWKELGILGLAMYGLKKGANFVKDRYYYSRALVKTFVTKPLNRRYHTLLRDREAIEQKSINFTENDPRPYRASLGPHAGEPPCPECVFPEEWGDSSGSKKRLISWFSGNGQKKNGKGKFPSCKDIVK